MGGDLRDFNDSSMFDYEARLAAWKVQAGVVEGDVTSTADLDDLYAAAADTIKADPEAWR